MVISISFLFSINVQTASKDELMCIKGIGDKKADAILNYRKITSLKSADDLLEIKGFGKALVSNVKNDIKSVSCGGTKSTKKITTQKKSTQKESLKKEDSKKNSEAKKSFEKSSSIEN